MRGQAFLFTLLDSLGKVVVRYVYDAWGNHKVLDASGNALTNLTHIGNLNPFRYRGYYYDTETKLYFLKTRYYDPEIGRFITIDDLQYLDPESINGLNLYAYCGNNPVMAVDPEGTMPKWLKKALNLAAAIMVVTLVTAAVVATAGGLALAVGAGAAMVNAIIAGAAVGGLAAGAAAICSQIATRGLGNIQMGAVAFESFVGAAYGALSGIMGATTYGGLRLAMRGAIVTLNTLAAGARTAMDEKATKGEIILSMRKSFMISMALQMIGVGVDFWKGTLTTNGREFAALHKTLFGNKELALVAGIQAGRFVVSPLLSLLKNAYLTTMDMFKKGNQIRGIAIV